MEFDLRLDICCDHRHLEHVSKVLGEASWVDLLDLATSEIGEPAQGLDIALITLNGNDIDSDASLLGNRTDLHIKVVSSFLFFLSQKPIEGAKTDVGKAIGADHYTRTGGSLCSHSD